MINRAVISTSRMGDEMFITMQLIHHDDYKGASSKIQSITPGFQVDTTCSKFDTQAEAVDHFINVLTSFKDFIVKAGI